MKFVLIANICIRLKLHYRLGSKELEAEINETAIEIIKRMESVLGEEPKGDSDYLNELVKEYMNVYKRINVNRNAAFKSVISRLDRMNTPHPHSKMVSPVYYWMMFSEKVF